LDFDSRAPSGATRSPSCGTAALGCAPHRCLLPPGGYAVFKVLLSAELEKNRPQSPDNKYVSRMYLSLRDLLVIRVEMAGDKDGIEH
jgi:hypothetical protein